MTPRDALPATIRTQRLTLRQPVASDIADIVAMANNPLMPRTTATLPYPFAEADGHALVAQAANNPALRSYAIVAADNRFMGQILFKFGDGELPELGYWLGEPHWGQGYAGEAVQGLIDAAGRLAGFERISAHVLEINPASVRVLEKAGFAIMLRRPAVAERHRGKPLVVLEWSAP